MGACWWPLISPFLAYSFIYIFLVVSQLSASNIFSSAIFTHVLISYFRSFLLDTKHLQLVILPRTFLSSSFHLRRGVLRLPPSRPSRHTCPLHLISHDLMAARLSPVVYSSSSPLHSSPPLPFWWDHLVFSSPFAFSNPSCLHSSATLRASRHWLNSCLF